MWIVSQNGEITVNTDTMQGFSVTNGNIEIWHDNKIHNLLGRYSSQEKAMKVRDKLIEEYRGVFVIKANKPSEIEIDGIKALLCKGEFVAVNGNYDFGSAGNVVVHMPQDEEVII